MDIAGLINRLGSTRREYAGTFYTVPALTRPRPFTASAELLRTDESISLEGGIRHGEAEAPIPFQLTLPFSKMHPFGGIAELSCTPLGRIQGDFLTCGPGFSFLAVAGVSAVSLHASFEGSGPSFKVNGIIRPYPDSLAFHAEPATQWEKSLQARLYSFPSRK